MSILKKGIDVSKHQGDIKWNLVKENIDFALIRAGYGKFISQKDKFFDSNYTNAKNNNIPLGCYWYSYALNEADALAEAKVFLEVIKDKIFEYPVCFDIEDPTQSSLSAETINKIIKVFCETVENAGYYVSLYSYKNFLETKVSETLKERFDIWVAHYDVEKTSFTGDYGMWQYSSKGSVDGISGNVDLNYAYKEYPLIISENGLNGFKKTSSSAKTTSATVNQTVSFKVGDKVKVKSGSKDYTGKSLAKFVYSTVYTVLEIKGKRAVIGINGEITAAVNTDNLIKQ